MERASIWEQFIGTWRMRHLLFIGRQLGITIRHSAEKLDKVKLLYSKVWT